MERREFLFKTGIGVAATMATNLVAFDDINAATQKIAHLPPGSVASDEDYWQLIQNSFDVSRNVINLNHAGCNACPSVVTRDLIDIIRETEKVPPYSLFKLLNPQLETIRKQLSIILKCSMEELSLVRNTTEAMHSIIMGCELKEGDEVLTTQHDYWGMLDALRQRSLRSGITVKKIPVPVAPKNDDELVEIFEKEITEKTKLIMVSHITNLGGHIFPIKKICEMAHAKDIEVAVDAAQSFGMIDFTMDDLDCDYLGTSLHKWLMGPKSTGLLYMKKDKIAKTWPIMPAPERYDNDIRKFERMGTIPAHFLALGPAITFHNGIGGKRKEARLHYLTQYWVNQLKDTPGITFNTPFTPNMSCAIVNVKIDGLKAYDIEHYLYEKHKIYLTSISKNIEENVDGLRVSPSLPTTLQELDVFSEVIDHIARRGLT